MHSLAWVKENFISINSVSLNPKVTSVCPLLLQVVDFLRGEGLVVVRRLWGYQQTHGCRLSTFCSRDKLMSLPAEHLLLLSNTFGVEWIYEFFLVHVRSALDKDMNVYATLQNLNFVLTLMNAVQHWWPDPLKIVSAEMSFSGRLKTRSLRER